MYVATTKIVQLINILTWLYSDVLLLRIIIMTVHVHLKNHFGIQIACPAVIVLQKLPIMM